MADTITIWQVFIEESGWRYVTPDLAAAVVSGGGAFEPRYDCIRLVDVPVDVPLKFDRQAYIHRPLEISKRRIAAAERALRQQREKAGLFGYLVTAEQPTAEERCQAADRAARESHEQWRLETAAKWWAVRRMLRSMPPGLRGRILHTYNDGFYPKNAGWCERLVRDWARKWGPEYGYVPEEEAKSAAATPAVAVA